MATAIDNAAINATIFKTELDGLAAKVERLARRAAKLGVDVPEITASVPFLASIDHKTGQLVRDGSGNYEAVEIVVTCPVVQLAGWDLVGRIEHVIAASGEPVNLIWCVPGRECPESFRDAAQQCDHCGYKRYRKDTYVVRNESTGEYKQVGSTCLGDFLGVSAEMWVMMATWLNDTEKELKEPRGLRAADAWNLMEILPLAAADIRGRGFWSRAKADIHNVAPTGAAVINGLFATRTNGGKRIEIAPEDYMTAKAVWGWLHGLRNRPTSEMSGYLANLSVVERCGYVAYNGISLLASAVAAYQREMGLIAERKAEREAAKESEHVGTVGERLTIDGAKCTGAYPYDGFYGPAVCYKFNAGGNLFVTFCSGSLKCDVGETYTLAGTVKNHDADRNTAAPVTVLTRVKAK